MHITDHSTLTTDSLKTVLHWILIHTQKYRQHSEITIRSVTESIMGNRRLCVLRLLQKHSVKTHKYRHKRSHRAVEYYQNCAYFY